MYLNSSVVLALLYAANTDNVAEQTGVKANRLPPGSILILSAIGLKYRYADTCGIFSKVTILLYYDLFKVVFANCIERFLLQMDLDCRLPCDCAIKELKCRLGVNIIQDGCGCCNMCARQQGELCNRKFRCDDRKGLYCDGSEDGQGVCKCKGIFCFGTHLDNGALQQLGNPCLCYTYVHVDW